MPAKRLLMGDDFWREGPAGNPCPDDTGKITSMLAHAATWLNISPGWSEENQTEGNIDWYFLADILDAIIMKIHQLENP